MLLLSTGVRASELCTARRADLDMAENSLKVTGKGRGTAGKERFVYFGQKTRRALWRYLVEHKELQDDGPLFVVEPDGEPRPMKRRALDTLLKRIGERAGVMDVYPHRFRHTFAVNYLRNGGNAFALMRVLGHTSIKMVSHYVNLAQADLAAIQRTADPGDRWNL
jgi:integrase/recombinase XerD